MATKLLPELASGLLQEGGDRIVFNLPSRGRDEAYEEVAQRYPDCKVEMDAAANIAVVLPVDIGGSGQEAEALTQVGAWNKQTKLGKVFSPQGLFRLPNGAKRMPDVAWMPIEEYRQLDQTRKDTYRGTVVPAFGIEIRSRTDDLLELQDKCREWVAEGVREAWLVDPIERRTHAFRHERGTVVLLTSIVPGPDFMPGLNLDLSPIWDDI